jgi:hypothetical protein
MVQRYGEYTYRQGLMRGIVGGERRGKETDGCPLIWTEFQGSHLDCSSHNVRSSPHKRGVKIPLACKNKWSSMSSTHFLLLITDIYYT